MRRLFPLVLPLLLLCACAARQTEPAAAPLSEPTPTVFSAPAPSPEPSPAPTPEPTPETSPEPTPSPVPCCEDAVFTEDFAPRELFRPCEQAGTVEMLSYTAADPRDGAARIEKRMAVYLPFGYDPAERYDLLILLHGLEGSERYWLVDFHDYDYGKQDYVFTVNLLDQMIARGLCRPMIVAAPSFYRDSARPGDFVRETDQPAFARELRENILPALVEHYSTWADTPEAIPEAREHFAYAGLSMGSMYAYGSILPECLDLFASFGCFSGSEGDMRALAALLNEKTAAYPIRVFYNSCGSWDGFCAEHQRRYEALTTLCDGLTDGENAAFTLLKNQRHLYGAWALGLYNFLPLLFRY